MRMDWLPISAAALLTGATALVIGAQLIPRPDGEGTLLRLAAENSDEWVALAILLTLAAVGLVVGMPSLFVLFQGRGFVTGLLGTFCLAVGAVSLAGFAQVLIVFRSLAVNAAASDEAIEAVARDTVQGGMLAVGFLTFYAGEVLLALALLRARTTPLWVPWAFLLHVALVPLQTMLLPDGTRAVGTVLMAAGFAGAGIAAVRRAGTPAGTVPLRG